MMKKFLILLLLAVMIYILFLFLVPVIFPYGEHKTLLTLRDNNHIIKIEELYGGATDSDYIHIIYDKQTVFAEKALLPTSIESVTIKGDSLFVVFKNTPCYNNPITICLPRDSEDLNKENK